MTVPATVDGDSKAVLKAEHLLLERTLLLAPFVLLQGVSVCGHCEARQEACQAHLQDRVTESAQVDCEWLCTHVMCTRCLV